MCPWISDRHLGIATDMFGMRSCLLRGCATHVAPIRCARVRSHCCCLGFRLCEPCCGAKGIFGRLFCTCLSTHVPSRRVLAERLCHACAHAGRSAWTGKNDIRRAPRSMAFRCALVGAPGFVGRRPEPGPGSVVHRHEASAVIVCRFVSSGRGHEEPRMLLQRRGSDRVLHARPRSPFIA